MTPTPPQAQSQPEDSPWTLLQRVRMQSWEWCWALFCRWTPKPCNRWRLLWLRIFGCRVVGRPFVHQRARISMPWNVILNDRACVGDLANLYSLALIEIGEGAIVAQEAYICTGSHDFSRPELPLIARSISIGAWAFVGARAFILPGRTVGEKAIVGACAVVTKDIPAHCVAYGHPAEIHQAKLPGKKRP